MDELQVHATSADTDGVLVSSASGRLELDYADRSDRGLLCPVELLGSALAGCVALTIRAVAAARGYPLERVDVDVTTVPDYALPPKAEHRVHIALQGDLDDKARTILFRSAKACHVHKILGGENAFHFELATDKNE